MCNAYIEDDQDTEGPSVRYRFKVVFAPGTSDVEGDVSFDYAD